MPCIKVGINEWIVVDTTNHNSFSLWTNGLSGCVGVAIITPPRMFMTHIDSHVSVQDWQQTVEAQFLAAIAHLGNLAQAQMCEFVIGDDQMTPLAEAVWATLRAAWAQADNENGDPSPNVRCGGVRAYFQGARFRIESEARMSYQAAWGTNQNSAQGAANIERQGFFPGGARADI